MPSNTDECERAQGQDSCGQSSVLVYQRLSACSVTVFVVPSSFHVDSPQADAGGCLMRIVMVNTCRPTSRTQSSKQSQVGQFTSAAVRFILCNIPKARRHTIGGPTRYFPRFDVG